MRGNLAEAHKMRDLAERLDPACVLLGKTAAKLAEANHNVQYNPLAG
jgi:hypothetical protein